MAGLLNIFWGEPTFDVGRTDVYNVQFEYDLNELDII